MRCPTACLLILCLLSSLVATEANDAPPVDPPHDPGVGTVDEQPERDLDEAAKALWRQLGSPPTLAVREGSLRWGDGPEAPLIVAVQRGDAVVRTIIGSVRVHPGMLADPEMAAAFQRLIGHAAAAGLGDAEGTSGFAARDSALTGPRLRRDTHVITLAGVLERQPPGAVRDTEVEALREASEAFVADFVAQEDIMRHTRRAVSDALGLLHRVDSGEEEGDELTPSYVRQVIRHGWLIDTFGDSPEARKLTEAVRVAGEVRATASFHGEGLTLEHRQDAFGQGGWIYDDGSIQRQAVNHPAPFYHWSAQKPMAQAVVVSELLPGSEPFAQRLQVSTLLRGDSPVVVWSRTDGLVADRSDWRQLVPERRGLDDAILAGYMPPHIAITDLNGELRALAVEAGLLLPPEDGGGDAERFFDEAAQLLPDAPHLDLIGQYIFRYVYDSPDARYPLLLGNREIKGDIHQTAEQTLQTTAGGICRGDCDDLSELYQTILQRQGRTAHVISLPAHAAAAWAEQRDDRWHVFVLQTGPGLEFSAERVQDALAAAYLRFDASDTFDPNGLGLLLRFSGENTRSAWRLSYRIFTEPDYAATMIDVQRDWHYQTYLQGFRKMEEMIAAGDHDTANYRELAGLASFTGQYAKAAAYKREAIDRTEEAESRLFELAELAYHLREAGDLDGVQAVVDEALDGLLPDLREELGPRIIQYGLQFAGILAGKDQTAPLAPEVLARTGRDQLGEILEVTASWLRNSFNEQTWRHHPQLRQYRRLLSWYARTASRILRHYDVGDLAHDEELRILARHTQRWIDEIAFRDVEDGSDLLGRLAAIAHYYEFVFGEDELLERVAAQAIPYSVTLPPEPRVGGAAQIALDLPLIRLAQGYWFGRLARILGVDDELGEAEETTDALDRAELRRIVPLLREAIAAVDRLDLDGPFEERQARLADLVLGLLERDEAIVRATLAEARARDDKRLRDDCAQWMGEIARHLPMDWWHQVLDIWVEELDYKPKYFWIAWRAALNRAPEHALVAARLAASRFPDETAFAEEAEFMAELLQEQATTAEPIQQPATTTAP